MRAKRIRKPRRRGATFAEFIIVLPIFLIAVFGMIDLALLNVRRQNLAQAARVGIRTLIVRGSSADSLGALGPGEMEFKASADNAIANVIRPHLHLMDPTKVSVKVTWLANTNTIGNRVRINLSATCTPITTYVFGNPTWSFSARSTMPIAH